MPVVSYFVDVAACVPYAATHYTLHGYTSVARNWICGLTESRHRLVSWPLIAGPVPVFLKAETSHWLSRRHTSCDPYTAMRRRRRFSGTFRLPEEERRMKRDDYVSL